MSNLDPPVASEASVPVAAGFWDALLLAGSLAELAAAIQRDDMEPLETLVLIAQTAVSIIPGAQCSAVVVPVGAGKLATRAVQGELPTRVMNLQNEIGEGPCLDAVTQTDQIWVPNTRQDTRWPQFGVRAAELGARSMICTPLVAGRTIIGSLTVSSSVVDGFEEESAALATVFGMHTCAALASVEGHRQLRGALDSRDVIGQAKGVLMERYRISADAAFALLARTSQSTNVKLRDVAEELCRSGTLVSLPADPPEIVRSAEGSGSPQVK